MRSSLTLAAFLFAVGLSSTSTHAAPFANGDFESDMSVGWTAQSNFQRVNDPSKAQSGSWYGEFTGAPTQGCCNNGLPSEGHNGEISQSWFDLLPGVSTYKLTFYGAPNTNSIWGNLIAGSFRYRIGDFYSFPRQYFGGFLAVDPFGLSGNNVPASGAVDWKKFEAILYLDWTGHSGSAQGVLSFYSFGFFGTGGFIDNITLTPYAEAEVTQVPLPFTMPLFAMGIAGLRILRGKRPR